MFKGNLQAICKSFHALPNTRNFSNIIRIKSCLQVWNFEWDFFFVVVDIGFGIGCVIVILRDREMSIHQETLKTKNTKY